MVGSGKDFESNLEMEDEIFGLDSGGNGNSKWNVVENKNRMKSWCNVSEIDSQKDKHLSRRRNNE